MRGLGLSEKMLAISPAMKPESNKTVGRSCGIIVTKNVLGLVVPRWQCAALGRLFTEHGPHT